MRFVRRNRPRQIVQSLPIPIRFLLQRRVLQFHFLQRDVGQRRVPATFLFVVLLALLASLNPALAEQYIVALHDQIPYLHAPCHAPGAPLSVITENPAAFTTQLHHCRYPAQGYSSQGFAIQISFRWYCGRKIGRCTLYAHPDAVYAKAEFAYPNFGPTDAYQKFWKEVVRSGCATSLTPGLNPAFSFVVEQLLWPEFASRRPLTFSDILKTEFALEGPNLGDTNPPDVPMIDVRPGMRFRLEHSISQELQAQRDGFVSGGISFLNPSLVTDYVTGTESLSFSPFFGNLRASTTSLRDSFGSADTRTGSGAFDTEFAPTPRKYWRVVYPTKFVRKLGEIAEPKQSIMLLGADDQDKLRSSVCSSFVQTVHFDGTSVGSDAYSFVVFRGRTLVVPEVSVTVQNERTHAEVGTTVRQFVERDVDWSTFATACGRIQLFRRYEGRLIPVCFVGNGDKLFALPLVKGDRLSW